MSDGQRILDEAFDALEREVPESFVRFIRWLRSPKSRLFRIPLGILFLAGGCLWFLPILGAWMLPLGLMLLAQDIPFLRKPIGRATLWMIAKWQGLKRWWRARSRAHSG